MSIGFKYTIASLTARSTSGASSSQAVLALPDEKLSLFLNVTNISNSSSMNVRPQWTDDGGTTWYDPEVPFPIVYGNTVAMTQAFQVHSNTFRVAWDIADNGSGTQSYTFGVNAFGALL